MTSRTATLFAAASVALVACKGKEAEATGTSSNDTATIQVVLDTLHASSFENWIAFPAELRGASDAQLITSTGGRVQSVVEVGTRVQAGQPLCDIESNRYAAMVAQAQAAVDLAQGELERSEANLKAGSVAKASVDKARLDSEGAKVQLLQAQRAYEDSRCQAPFSGVLASRSIDQYQTIPPGSPTVRVARTDKLEALVSIPEGDMSGFSKGAPVRFEFAALAEQEFTGKLRTMDYSVDSRTRTASARIEVVNVGNRLNPGMAGKASILRNTLEDVVVIPTTSILRDENGAFAMVADKGVAHRRRLELGPSTGDSIVVIKGLESGDALVTVGAFRLNEGSRVKR